MLKVKDYEEDFKNLGISMAEGEIVLSYLSELAEIGISCLMNNELKNEEYD